MIHLDFIDKLSIILNLLHLKGWDIKTRMSAVSPTSASMIISSHGEDFAIVTTCADVVIFHGSSQSAKLTYDLLMRELNKERPTHKAFTGHGIVFDVLINYNIERFKELLSCCHNDRDKIDFCCIRLIANGKPKKKALCTLIDTWLKKLEKEAQ